MKVAIVGAGVIGVTTAYELSEDGHEVTVFERHSQVGEGTSFANAGVMSPGYVAPWAAPGMPAKVLKQMLGRHASVRLRFPLSVSEVHWIWRWWRACNPESFRVNRTRMQRLAVYSRRRLEEVRAAARIEYERTNGYMVLLRNEKDLRLIEPSLAVLRESGIRFRQLNCSEARKVEPALNPDTSFVGGIHLPEDEIGNCRQFTVMLKSALIARGVRFSFNSTVSAINPGRAPSLQVGGEKFEHVFDAIVLCAGPASTEILRDFGCAIPMVPVYGYSISAPIREAFHAPRSAIMDEQFKVAITRMGNRIRVAGSAELGGDAGKQCSKALQTLYKVLHEWFPGAAATNQGVQHWKGARPMLPEGPPIIGRSLYPGVWLNLGHGSSGWAMSCGSARLLADALIGRMPDMDMTGFGVDRYCR